MMKSCNNKILNELEKTLLYRHQHQLFSTLHHLCNLSKLQRLLFCFVDVVKLQEYHIFIENVKCGKSERP